jgi:hypothetical protein
LISTQRALGHLQNQQRDALVSQIQLFHICLVDIMKKTSLVIALESLLKTISEEPNRQKLIRLVLLELEVQTK